jgi:hypothetical protein
MAGILPTAPAGDGGAQNVDCEEDQTRMGILASFRTRLLAACSSRVAHRQFVFS